MFPFLLVQLRRGRWPCPCERRPPSTPYLKPRPAGPAAHRVFSGYLNHSQWFSGFVSPLRNYRYRPYVLDRFHLSTDQLFKVLSPKLISSETEPGKPVLHKINLPSPPGDAFLKDFPVGRGRAPPERHLPAFARPYFLIFFFLFCFHVVFVPYRFLQEPSYSAFALFCG